MCLVICNKDCLHCKFDDCINDRLDQEDVEASDRRDRMTGSAPMRTTQEQKERDRARAREYYYAHREQKIERRKKWVEENRERDRAYKRAYYWAHREKILARSKEKRKKGKVEK